MDICHVYILRLVVWMGYLQSTSTQETTCYYGWTEFSGHCYYFSDSMFSRDEAIEDCIGRGNSNLATVANQDTNDFIRDNRPSSEPYWIGLRPFDDSSWGWNDGRIDRMIVWHDNQPSNSSSCGVFWSDVPAFYTHKCNDHRQYICESDVQHGDDWSTYNGHWYAVITDTATQPEAANYCIYLDGYLARLTTSDEIAFARRLATGHLWVGLTSLEWDDGNAYNWNNWEDNTHIPHSPCAALDKDTDKWILNDCHHENYFICSTAPQLQIYTWGGSAEGAPCVFPFIYDETVYYGCTSINVNKPWCSTTHNYQGNRKWGNCPTISVTQSTIKTPTLLVNTTSAPVITTTQTPIQTTLRDTVGYTRKFSSYSETTFNPLTSVFESPMSRDITESTSLSQDIADLSKLHEYNVLHVLLGVVFGIAAVVIISLLAAIYWKRRTKASENPTQSLQLQNEETGNHVQNNNGYYTASTKANIESHEGESGGYQELDFGKLDDGETENYGTDNNGHYTATGSNAGESEGYQDLDFENEETRNHGQDNSGYHTATTEANIGSHEGESGGYQALDFGIDTK